MMRTFTGSTTISPKQTRGNAIGKVMINLLENHRVPEELERLNNLCGQQGLPPKYDIRKAPMNVEWEKALTIEEAYDNVFTESVERYNATQSRKDRHTTVAKVLSNYRRLNKGEDLQSIIVQVGNEKSKPSDEECELILREYREEFIKRFPNIKLVSCCIHKDEVTLHLEAYFIGVKYKDMSPNPEKWRGIDTQPSMSGALIQMGYDDSKTVRYRKVDAKGEYVIDENGEYIEEEVHDYQNGAMAQFRKDANELLDEICLNHSIVIEHPLKGQKVSHQDTIRYQQGEVQEATLAALNKEKEAIERERIAMEKVDKAEKRLKEVQDVFKEIVGPYYQARMNTMQMIAGIVNQRKREKFLELQDTIFGEFDACGEWLEAYSIDVQEDEYETAVDKLGAGLKKANLFNAAVECGTEEELVELEKEL